MLKATSIKIPADFTELLDLSTLETQMKVLSHLTNNLAEYQNNFLKSHLKTADELLDYIPKRQHKSFSISLFILGNNTTIMLSELQQILNKFQSSTALDDDIKYAITNTKYIVDTSNKKIIPIVDTSGFVFDLNEDNIMLASYIKTINRNAKSYYRYETWEEIRIETTIHFNIAANTIIKSNHYVSSAEPKDRKW